MDKKLKLAYLTANAPFGKGETFINEEIAVISKYFKVLIIPRDSKKQFHKPNFHYKNIEILKTKILNFRILKCFIRYLLKKDFYELLKILIKDKKSLAKNLVILPKAIFISEYLSKRKIDLIICHWGGTTATIALISNILKKIPYVITYHRWDIYSPNLTYIKVKNSLFVRVISEKGKNDLLKLCNYEFLNKIIKIHMGVCINIIKSNIKTSEKKFTIACPANLYKVKGHYYLIKAMDYLVNVLNLSNIQLLIIGEGYLKKKLMSLVNKLKLNENIYFLGALPHNELINLYFKKKINLVVLPSIEIDNEFEGIPVSLMEAMSYNIPVISTFSGSIPELLSECGVLVPQKDYLAIANEIYKFYTNKKYYLTQALKVFCEVEKNFNIEKNTKTLIDTIYKYLCKN